MRSIAIHEAVRSACERFRERTGLNPYEFLAGRLDRSPVSIYQYAEGREDSLPRRGISAADAVLVTNTFNAEYDRRGLYREHGIVRANAGLLCIEEPRACAASGERAVARTLGELNDLVQAFCKAVTDGVSGEELESIKREAFEVHEAVEALVAEAAARCETAKVRALVAKRLAKEAHT
jgi:hypothetical protein